MVKYCKCGCGTVIPEKNTWACGHNTRVNHNMKNPETAKKSAESHKGLKRSDTTKEKMSKLAKDRWKNPVLRKKMSDPHKGIKHSITTKKKMSEAHKKYYAEMDDPGQQMCKHHYIYDFNDLTKYIIIVTRSEHMTIHQNLRHAGLEVPCINIMKDEHGEDDG